MSGSIPPQAILNPHTPLAFLPPDVADQFQAVCYVYVATLSAYGWDWLMALPEEFKMLRKSPSKLTLVAYFLSRIGTLGSVVSVTAYRVAPSSNCAALQYVEGIFFIIGVPSTSLLFLLRVRAVYANSRIVTAFFGTIWLAILATSVLILTGISGDRIPFTDRCTEGLRHKYTTVPILLTAINDTLVFIAISWQMLRISMNSNTKNWRAKTEAFVWGRGLHHVSKAVLQGGQAYYFATIGVGIVAAALILSPSVPGPIHPIMGNSYFALGSAMACKVFRSLKVGTLLEEDGTAFSTKTPPMPPMFIHSMNHQPNPTVDGIPLEVQVRVESESDFNQKNPQDWPDDDHTSRSKTRGQDWV